MKKTVLLGIMLITAMIPFIAPSAFADETASTENTSERAGVVSSLNANNNNPYHSLISVDIDVGSEFATFDGSSNSEGLIIKGNDGDWINLPKVTAKPGYIFIGWGEGGVSDPEWDLNTQRIQISVEDKTQRTTSIYALYTDADGNGYCTCGAYKQGAFADKISEYKQAYLSYENTTVNQAFPMMLVCAFACIIFICTACIHDYRHISVLDNEDIQ